MLLMIEYERNDFFGDSLLIKFIVLDDVYDRG